MDSLVLSVHSLRWRVTPMTSCCVFVCMETSRYLEARNSDYLFVCQAITASLGGMKNPIQIFTLWMTLSPASHQIPRYSQRAKSLAWRVSGQRFIICTNLNAICIFMWYMITIIRSWCERSAAQWFFCHLICFPCSRLSSLKVSVVLLSQKL